MERTVYRIGFTGVFDLANYGDHLFPVIFKNEMKKRSIECELVLFSVFECEQAFGEPNHVFSIYDLDRIHEEEPFDAIVVGGGDIVHFNSFKHKMEGIGYTDYPIFDLWVIPSLFAAKYGVRLIWNSPGIPFDFEGAYQEIARHLLSQADYLSVRNPASKSAVEKCGAGTEAVCVPDTALLLRGYFGEMEEERREIAERWGKKYAVVHISKLLEEESVKILAKQLGKLEENGYRLVLLPLAYTNDDRLALENLNRQMGYRGVLPAEDLNIRQTAAILAGCDLYIGFSFHGAITAYAYGKKAIAFNYTNNRKTEELFGLFGKPEYHVTAVSELEKVLENVLKDETEYHFKQSGINTRIERHFDRIGDILRKENGSGRRQNEEISYRQISRILTQMSLKEQEHWSERVRLNQEWMNCLGELEFANRERQRLHELYMKTLEEKRALEARRSFWKWWRR